MRLFLRATTSRLAAAAVLMAPAAAWAQAGAPATAPQGDSTIVVTADRVIIAALRGVSPEREYDERDVAAYGASSVGEFIDQVQGENGDDQAIYLINGEPVSDVDEVADFPAEAVERLEVLPRGSGQRIGRESDRRVYNVVLKKQLRSATLSAGRKVATEGEWGETNGEGILSRIAGRQRLNLTLRARDSDGLTENDRGVVQPDPAALTGSADYFEPIDAGAFRTLRGPSRSYEASLIGGMPVLPWLTSSFSLVGRTNRDRSLSGLPPRTFLLSGSSAFSPTGTDQRLVLFGSDPQANRSRRQSVTGNLNLNASWGSWMAGLSGKVGVIDSHYDNDRLDRSGAPEPIAVPAGTNPYVDPLDQFFAFTTDLTRTNQRSWLARFNIGGPVFRLPAGDFRLRASAQRDGDRSHSTSRRSAVTTERSYKRATTQFDGGIDIPLASQDFLAPLGQLTLSLDRGLSAIDNLPNLDRSSATLLWQPSQRVSVTGFAGKTQELPAIELLADPVVVYDNVRSFDVLTGETVDVTVITGGNPSLKPLSTTKRRLSFSAAPWLRYNLQLNAEYEATTVRNFASGVPAASTPVYLAFPDRFQRDASGRLVVIDSRPVNFDREQREELRYGVSFMLPLGPRAAAGAPAAPQASQPRLQVTASHSIVLRDIVSIRAGLPRIDLLEGGAVGVGGGRARHLVTGSVAVTDRGYGVRLTGLYRSAASLQAGTTALPETLKFAPIFTASLHAHAELEPLIPKTAWLKDTRLSLTVENLGDHRQRVTDSAGLTPLRYQPAYRDPIGRTVLLEIRKVF
jgi:hypothetical protein